MAILNPANYEYFLVKETVEGITPTAPVFIRMEQTEAEFNLESAKIESKMKNANRAAGDSLVGMKSGTGSVSTEFRRSNANDAMIETCLSGTFVGNVLKAGVTDTFYTIARRMGPGINQIFTGNIGSQFSVEAQKGEMVTASFEFTFLDKQTSTEADIVEDATFPVQSLGAKQSGNTANVTLTGITAPFRMASIEVTQGRDLLGQLGSNVAAGIATESREVKMSVEFYREDLTPDLIFDGSSNTPFDLTLTIGSGVNGYSFRLPRAFAAYPQDSADGGAGIVTIEFTASGENAMNTDIIVTKLA